MPALQNFSVVANNDTDVNFDVGPDDGGSLIGTTIYWRAYEQENGSPVPGADPVISKTLDDGLQITDPDLGKFVVELDATDTVELLRNYYHEATIVDGDGATVTVTFGIMTVTPSENRFA